MRYTLFTRTKKHFFSQTPSHPRICIFSNLARARKHVVALPSQIEMFTGVPSAGTQTRTSRTSLISECLKGPNKIRHTKRRRRKFGTSQMSRAPNINHLMRLYLFMFIYIHLCICCSPLPIKFFRFLLWIFRGHKLFRRSLSPHQTKIK